jgi:hypothetical protein
MASLTSGQHHEGTTVLASTLRAESTLNPPLPVRLRREAASSSSTPRGGPGVSLRRRYRPSPHQAVRALASLLQNGRLLRLGPSGLRTCFRPWAPAPASLPSRAHAPQVGQENEKENGKENDVEQERDQEREGEGISDEAVLRRRGSVVDQVLEVDRARGKSEAGGCACMPCIVYTWRIILSRMS